MIEVEGVVVEAAGNYALRDDQGALWWFDNNKVVFQFRQIGPDYHVKDIGGNYVDLTDLFDFVVDAEYYRERADHRRWERLGISGRLPDA